MPSSTKPFTRPAYGQMWEYSMSRMTRPMLMMLIAPVDGPQDHRWNALVFRDMGLSDDFGGIEMSGLYPDRAPITGYTLVAM